MRATQFSVQHDNQQEGLLLELLSYTSLISKLHTRELSLRNYYHHSYAHTNTIFTHS